RQKSRSLAGVPRGRLGSPHEPAGNGLRARGSVRWWQARAAVRGANGPGDRGRRGHRRGDRRPAGGRGGRGAAAGHRRRPRGGRAVVAAVRARAGAVVLTSSVHALVGLPGRPAYAASKAGLTGLGRQLAVEYGPEVRVNCVLPGPVLTAAWEDVDEERRQASA